MPKTQNVTNLCAGDADIPLLVTRLYGADDVSCTRLNSYDDMNYHILTRPLSHSKLQETEFVLKIMHADHKVSSVRAQTKLLLHSAANGIAVPAPVQNVDGEYWSQEPFESEHGAVEMRIVRLLTYIPGRLLGSSPVTEELLVEAGSYLARFHTSIKGVSDEDFDRADYIWTLANIPRLKAYVSAVPDPERRDLAIAVIDSWDYVEQKCSYFTEGIQHGDPNEMNIIVTEGLPERICGLIDFSDAHTGYFVYDVAMLIAYMLMYSDVDLLDVGMHVLAGYTATMALNASELNVLFHAVAGRLAQSVVLGLHTYSLTGNQYVLNTQAPGWRVLCRLWDTGKDCVLRHWLAGVHELSQPGSSGGTS